MPKGGKKFALFILEMMCLIFCKVLSNFFSQHVQLEVCLQLNSDFPIICKFVFHMASLFNFQRKEQPFALLCLDGGKERNLERICSKEPEKYLETRDLLS